MNKINITKNGVLEAIDERIERTQQRLRDLESQHGQLKNGRETVQSSESGDTPDRIEWRRGFDDATAPLAGHTFDQPVSANRFIAALVADCGLTLPQARAALRTAIDRRLWVCISENTLRENGNVNPASQEPPDQSCCGVAFDTREGFYDHVAEEHPLGGSA